MIDNKERIDLVWLSQKIPAFADLMKQVQDTKASEREYLEKYRVSPPSEPQSQS